VRSKHVRLALAAIALLSVPLLWAGAGAKGYALVREGVGVEGAIVGCTTRSEIFDNRTAEDFPREGLEFSFGENNRLTAVTVTSVKYRTGRGLRIGSSEAELKKVYGLPRVEPITLWKGSQPIGAVGAAFWTYPGIRFMMAHRKVAAMMVVPLAADPELPGSGPCAKRGDEAKRIGPTPNGCDIGRFSTTASEHIVVEIDEPFVVRSVEGTLTSQVGEWPSDVTVLFELCAVGGAGPNRSVRTDASGRFRVRDVALGTYCFKATVEGWQSVLGVVIVSKTADRRRRIDFRMPRGL
jgi:hypothetical protein